MLHLGFPWLPPTCIVRRLSHLRFLPVRRQCLILEELNRQARFCVPYFSWGTHAHNYQLMKIENHLPYNDKRGRKHGYILSPEISWFLQPVTPTEEAQLRPDTVLRESSGLWWQKSQSSGVEPIRNPYFHIISFLFAWKNNSLILLILKSNLTME